MRWRCVVHLAQPDEAGAEHGAGGGEECGAEGVEGGEGAGQMALQIVRHSDEIGGECAEEEMVVVGH